MSKLLRYFAQGQYCFITAVTAQRQPVLVQHRGLLFRAAAKARRKSSFRLLAWVILPDHFHAIMDSPDGNVPVIVQRVKLSFSLSQQRVTRNGGPVWQHRYWDHIIRSEEDFKRHLDYIHYNPVKHGLTNLASIWPLSSFQAYLRAGYYSWDWTDKRMVSEEDNFGE